MNFTFERQIALDVPYMFVALRRVYEEPRGKTFAKTVGLLC